MPWENVERTSEQSLHAQRPATELSSSRERRPAPAGRESHIQQEGRGAQNRGPDARECRPTRASDRDCCLHYMSFPRQHRTKLHSTNPIDRLNKEVKRRADVVGIFPNEASIMRLIGAVLFEQNDERQTSSRYMMVEAFAQIDKKEIDPILSITTKAA